MNIDTVFIAIKVLQRISLPKLQTEKNVKIMRFAICTPPHKFLRK